jgi:hypothetical protein
MERTKLKFFLEQGCRVCLLLTIQITQRGGYPDGQAQGPAPTLEKLQEIVDELNNQTKNASDTEHSMKSSSRNEKSHGVHLELECAKSIFC